MMKENRMTVAIETTASVLFAYTTDPGNTPLWIDSIVYEEMSGTVAGLGAIYRNVDGAGQWAEYEVTAFQQDISFTLSRVNAAYHVRYTFTPLGPQWCELEYHEWAAIGHLPDPLGQRALDRLKSLVGQLAPVSRESP